MVLLALFFILTPAVFATTYYVDGANVGGTCSDVAAGTGLATAWCTVGKAASTAVAGDTVNIRSATYREVVTPLNSGSLGNPITYQRYLSETPIISAAVAGTGFASLGITESATGLFTDGFENNDNTFQNFNAGAGDTVDAGNTLLIQATTSNNGGYALAATYGGTNRNARVATTLTGTSTDVYQRMYFRINSGYDIIANDVGQIIMNLRIDSATSRGAVELLQNASGQFYLRGRAVNPATTTVSVFGATAPGSIVPNTWYSIELRYKGGATTTGGAELWLNGSSTGSIYAFNTSTTTIGRAEWGGGTSGTGVAASGSVMYIDDIKVATTSIGAFVAAGPANIYKKTNVTGDPNNIFENNTRMATGSSATTLTAGSYYYDAVADILYIRTSDSSNPNTKTIDIPFWNEGFLIQNKQYLVFDGLTVKYNDGAGVLDGGFVLATSSNIIIRNSTSVDNFGVGVYLNNTSSSTITNNQILRNQRDFGGGLRLENNSNTNVISTNTITGLGVEGGNGINMCGDSGCGGVGNNYNIIRSNIFYNLRDSCVYVGSRSDYNVLEQNTCGLTFRVNGVGGTGFHVSRGSDYNILRNNIFYDTYGPGILVQSNTIDSVEVPVIGNQVLNNVIYNPSTSIVGNHGGISVVDEAYNTVIKNNIIYQANDVSGLRVTGAAATSTDSDYNLYYSTKPSVTSMFHYGVSSGIFYNNLTTFKAAYPTQEVHSLSVEPEFTLPASLNFTTATTSPAIDSGTSTLSVLNDILGLVRPQGLAYDMGAYERLAGADVLAPTISAVASTTSNTSATITWTTNETADSQIIYGLTTAYGATTTLDSTLVTSHSVTVTGLSVATLYHYKIRTADSTGNVTVSPDYTFTTSAVIDSTPPILFAISASVSTNDATISWTTNEGADSQVNYGLSTSYSATSTLATSLVTNHSVTLTSLTAGTLYHYRVRSQDVSSNLATSSDYTFTTTAASTGGSSSGGGGGSGSGGRKAPVVTVPSIVITGQPSTGTFRAITFPLGPTMKSAEVYLLQQMLASDSTLYPSGELTGFYGPMTQRAVERFQTKYGLLTGGTPATNGFGNVGPTTLAKINAVYAGVSTANTVTPLASVVNNNQKIAQLAALLTLLQQLLALVQAGN